MRLSRLRFHFILFSEGSNVGLTEQSLSFFRFLYLCSSAPSDLTPLLSQALLQELWLKMGLLHLAHPKLVRLSAFHLGSSDQATVIVEAETSVSFLQLQALQASAARPTRLG